MLSEKMDFGHSGSIKYYRKGDLKQYPAINGRSESQRNNPSTAKVPNIETPRFVQRSPAARAHRAGQRAAKLSLPTSERRSSHVF